MVDGGSTDATVSEARQAGAQVAYPSSPYPDRLMSASARTTAASTFPTVWLLLSGRAATEAHRHELASVSNICRAAMQVITSPRGRGTQLNAGARRATGDLLLFLHADSALPAMYGLSIAKALERQSLRRQRPARHGLASVVTTRQRLTVSVAPSTFTPLQLVHPMRRAAKTLLGFALRER